MTEVSVVEKLWPLSMLQSVSVAADRTEVAECFDSRRGRAGRGDGGADALANADAAVCVGGGKTERRWQTDVTAEAAEVTEVSMMTVVETLWPLPMLQSVSVAADGWRWQSERPA